MSLSLIGLAFLAGVVTVLSPCILPMLPILMGRSLHHHRWGPLALIAGLVVSFACTGILLGFSAQFLRPLSQLLRQVAITVLLGIGLGAAFPGCRDRVWQWLPKPPFNSWSRRQRLSPSANPPVSTGIFWAEFGVGTQLGILWIPCAGPILGSILTLIVVEQQIQLGFLALLAYASGAGIPMLALAYGSRRILTQAKGLYPHMQRIQRVAGLVIALTAVGILLRWDVWIQVQLAPLFPPLIL